MPDQKRDQQDWLARRTAIVQAGRSHDVDGLIAGLADPDHRPKAARYLGRAGDARAIPPLRRVLLTAGDAHARAEAATALGNLGARDCLDDLLTTAANDPEGFVRAWAVDAVRLIGDRSAVGAIIPLLDDPDRRVRQIAVITLADLGGQSAAEALQQAGSKRPAHQRLKYRRAARRARTTNADDK